MLRKVRVLRWLLRHGWLCGRRRWDEAIALEDRIHDDLIRLGYPLATAEAMRRELEQRRISDVG